MRAVVFVFERALAVGAFDVDEAVEELTSRVDNEFEVEAARAKTLERAAAVGALEVEAEFEELTRRVDSVFCALKAVV